MRRIEQAIYAWVENEHSAGYRLVARSAGILAADAEELATWCPTHESMLQPGPEATNVSFHPLPSGAYCVSRTVLVGSACHSGGQRALTHCLIVPAKVLAYFGNNPFAILEAAASQNSWRSHWDGGAVLEPLVLDGNFSASAAALLTELAENPGAGNMAALVQTACDAPFFAVGGTPSPEKLIAGLIDCLPMECRTEFSFSTGLKFSPRRPFRIVSLSGDPAEHEWITHYPNVAVLQIAAGHAPPKMPLDGWAQLVERSLLTGGISYLVAQLSKRRFRLTLGDLPALGLQLLEGLEGADWDHDPLLSPGSAATGPGLPPAQRADAPHRKFANLTKQPMATACSVAGPSLELDPDSPAVLEKLEHLDDLVFEAINGEIESMQELQLAWPKLVDELKEDILADSREQYLRYALTIWEECADGDTVRHPLRAIQALDVLCLLFGEMPVE